MTATRLIRNALLSFPRLFIFRLVPALCLSFAPAPALAIDTVVIPSPVSAPVFTYDYYNQDEYFSYGDEDGTSDWTLSAALRRPIESAGVHWSRILGKGAAGVSPAVIAILAMENFDNDSAYSAPITQGPYKGFTELAGQVIKGFSSGDKTKAMIMIGDWPAYGGVAFYDTDPVLRQLPVNGEKFPLAAVIVHELGHALGVSSSSSYDETVMFPLGKFGDTLSVWDQHLYNEFGDRPAPGRWIVGDPALLAKYPDAFLVQVDQNARSGGNLYFRGAHVSEVLAGAMRNQVPINAWEDHGVEGWAAEFSHIETRNGMMSHQNYRNYGTFMEVELAMLQDLGYKIDRKNFFGRSIYGDGLTVDNHGGYFARNAAGDAYLPGQYNLTPLGVGLHIYGTNNTVTQYGNILAAGFNSIGIRVDGWDNRISVAPDAKVRSNGTEGIGVAVAYGKNHELVLRGEITALGKNGKAVSLDFGSNLMSDLFEVRGSYIYTTFESGNWGYAGPLPEEINGPLVKRLDISGSLTGGGNAVYISPNAYVQEINVLRGASLQGGIRSLWNPDGSDKYYTRHLNPETLITNLTFGLAMDSNGNALPGKADANFAMVYAGDINGPKSLAVSVEGGRLQYNGTANVISVSNKAGATLAGNGTFNISSLAGTVLDNRYANDFVNLGILAPGGGAPGKMTVNLGQYGNFISHGTLNIGFTAAGRHDTIVVNGDASSTASFSGNLNYLPRRGYFAGNSRIAMDQSAFLLTSPDLNRVVNLKPAALLATSPTLSFSLQSQGAGRDLIIAGRAPDAYSRYAANGQSASLGQELYRMAAANPQDQRTQNLLTAVDFAGTGQDVQNALSAMLPDLFNTAARASLDTQRLLSAALLGRILPAGTNAGNGTLISYEPTTAPAAGENEAVAAAGPGVYAFVTPLGGGGKQSARSGVSSYDFWQAGLLAGLEKRDARSVAGVHAAAAYLNLDGANPRDSLEGGSFYLGAHGFLNPESWGSGYLFGQARLGLDCYDQERDVRIGRDKSLNKSDWTGFSASALAGAGYDFTAGEMRFGPLVLLDYALSWRPGVTESGDLAALDLDDEAYNSLRSGLGLRAAVPLGESLDLSATALWNHEFMDNLGRTSAGFVGWGNAAFSSEAEVAGRDSLSATLGLSAQVSDNASLSLDAGGEFFRNGYNAAWGGLSFSWGF